MDATIEFQLRHEDFRKEVIQAIYGFEAKHENIKVQVEFDEDTEITWQTFEDQSANEVISRVENHNAIITFEGEEVQKQHLEWLSTEKLVELVMSMETSYEQSVESLTKIHYWDENDSENKKVGSIIDHNGHFGAVTLLDEKGNVKIIPAKQTKMIVEIK